MYIVFDINHKEDGTISVFSENLIDLNIVSSERVSCGVPSHKFLFLADLNEDNNTLRIMSNIDSWKR